MGILSDIRVKIRLEHIVFPYRHGRYFGETLTLRYYSKESVDPTKPYTQVASVIIDNHRDIEKIISHSNSNSGLQPAMLAISEIVLGRSQRMAIKGSVLQQSRKQDVRPQFLEALRFSFPSLEGELY